MERKVVKFEQWGDKVVKDLVNKIGKGQIVPILGYKAFYATHNRIPVQKFVVEEVLKKEGLYPIDNIDAYADGIIGMTKLDRLFCHKELDLNTSLVDLYESEDFYNQIYFEEEVLRFLELGRFPLIISTVNFSFINNLFEKHGLKYHLIPYQGVKSQDIRLEGEQLVEPSLINIFGIVGTNANSVICEIDLLLFLRRILDTNSMPKNLKKYLYNFETQSARNIITLGCELPDWTFRLLLYSLKELDCDKKNKPGLNTFGGGFVSTRLEYDLWDFLSDIRYKLGNDFSYLEQINKQLQPHHPPKREKIFLSLCSEDYEDVGEKIKKLLSSKYDVWMFKYDGGKDYWNRIKQGISQCRFFMPVITASTILRLQELSDASQIELDISGGLICEWKMALENKMENYKNDMYCIPVLQKITNKKFRDELLKKDHEKKYLWPLFYGENAVEGITGELTLEEVAKYTESKN